MSLEMSLRIKKKIITKSEFEYSVKKFFNNKELNAVNNYIYGISIHDFYNSYGIIFTLIEDKKPPYNIYDSELIKGEYEYSQVLSFEIDKTRELNIIYDTIFKYVLNMVKKFHLEALLTSDFSEDICLFQTDEVYYNKNVTIYNPDILIPEFNKINKI